MSNPGRHVSGKSRRRLEIKQRMKKRMLKGGYMIINEALAIDPETWDRLKAVTAYLERT